MPWHKHATLSLHIFAAFFAVFIIGPLFWAAIDRDPAYVVRSLHVIPSDIPAGAPATLEWNFTVGRQGCTGSFYRAVTDASGLTRVFDSIQDTFVLLPNGTYTTRNTHPFIAPIAVPGPATLTVRIQTSCNWVQDLWPVKQEVNAYFVITDPSRGTK